MANHRLTVTEVADALGVVPKTLIRWEKSGKIKKPKRNWRGWRVYTKVDLEELKMFHEAVY